MEIGNFDIRYVRGRLNRVLDALDSFNASDLARELAQIGSVVDGPAMLAEGNRLNIVATDDVERLKDAVTTAIMSLVAVNVDAGLSAVTGNFVGLTVEILRRKGYESDKQIDLSGGSRKITIHAVDVLGAEKE